MTAPVASREVASIGAGSAGATQARVDQEITPGLAASYQFSRLFNYLGPLVFRCLERSDYPWEVFCRVMRGDRSFSRDQKRPATGYLIPQTPGKICQKPTHRLKRGALW